MSQGEAGGSHTAIKQSKQELGIKLALQLAIIFIMSSTTPMRIIMAPSKMMNFAPPPPTPFTITSPRFLSSEVGSGGKLSKFWKKEVGVSESLLSEFGGSAGILVNAASKEYSDLIDFKAFKEAGVEVVDISLVKANTDGKKAVPTVHAKYARGAMAKWICDNRIAGVDGLKEWDGEGFSFLKHGTVKEGKTGSIVLVFEKEEGGGGG
ncbi:hypothetical protein TrRE_jg8915, partial [Triparma retinervis]